MANNINYNPENSPRIDSSGIENHININVNNPISKCSSNCKFCDNFDTDNIIFSSSTNRSYPSVIPENISNVNCKSKNCIYIITCKNCSLQYVGETSNAIKTRFNNHRSNIKHYQKSGFCKRLCHHFNIGLCRNSTYKVQILEKLDDKEESNVRKQKEKDWMLRLRTVFPFGMNDRIGDEYKRQDVSISSNFPSLSRRHHH